LFPGRTAPSLCLTSHRHAQNIGKRKPAVAAYVTFVSMFAVAVLVALTAALAPKVVFAARRAGRVTISKLTEQTMGDSPMTKAACAPMAGSDPPK
jgi:hypothetical protein